MRIYNETNRTLRDVWQYYRYVLRDGLLDEKYRHLLLLIYWPVYGVFFWAVERALPLSFHPVFCPLDEYIPFCEYFIYPYLFWFVLLIGMLVYTLLFNIPAFINYMKYIIITYSVTIVIYLIYPTMQELRPTEFVRDNLATAIVQWQYGFDTNTNVCPSIHVLGSVAACLAGLQCRRFSTVGWHVFLIASATLVSVSTVFVKQHSAVDILAALILCAAAYLPVYMTKIKPAQTVLDI